MPPSKTGTYLGVPYDWNKPTWSQIKQNMWNPKDNRILLPRVFGWGWSMNFYQLFRKMGLIKK